MIRFIFRAAALFCLALACIMGVLDAARSVAAESVVLTPLADSWSRTFPASLDFVGALIRQYLPEMIWDPVVLWILSQPGFAVFAVLALLFHFAGRKPVRRAGPFAAA